MKSNNKLVKKVIGVKVNRAKSSAAKSKSPKIAILAWGSLLTNNVKFNNPIVEKWLPNGPEVKLEFSRISNDGRLTPVIDEKSAVAAPVYYGFSTENSVGKAVKAFSRLEGISEERISVLNAKESKANKCSERHAQTTQEIYNWAMENNIDAVIWNGLGRKFKEKVGSSFTVERAIAYYNSMDKKLKTAFVKYVKALPKEVKTPFRDSLTRLVG